MPETIAGVILAGGQSRRMGGGDKCLLQLEGRTLLGRVQERLAPQVDMLVLNANGDPKRFSACGLPVIADSEPDYPGPLAGVLAGLDWAAGQGADRMVSVAADTPFFPTDLVQRLAETGPGIVLSASPDPDGRVWSHPTFALWPVGLRDDLRAALRAGVRKIVQWTDRHGALRTIFPSDPWDPFFNINTPQDMSLAEAKLSAGVL